MRSAEPPLEYWIAYLVLTVALGLWAHGWGRNPLAWAAIALLFTPLIAAISLLIKGPQRALR